MRDRDDEVRIKGPLKKVRFHIEEPELKHERRKRSRKGRRRGKRGDR